MQALCDCLPTVLAPKTIDNDLGLNYPNEPDEWVRAKGSTIPVRPKGYSLTRERSPTPASISTRWSTT